MGRTYQSQSFSHAAIKGVGIGLRAQHYQHILSSKPDTPWFEVLIDNYMGKGGQPLDYLEEIRCNYPITFHGVGMSLGSTEPLNRIYFNKLKQLIRQYQPAWISDHLCWCAHGRHTSNELLPLPYTEESIHHMVTRIMQAQDMLGTQILLENVSSYVDYIDSYMPEWEFINAIAEAADCLILFDVNNVYVSAYNHEYNAQDYITGINAQRVREIHLAGFEYMGTHLLDTHGQAVHAPVWNLYKQAIAKFGEVPTLIEWDTDIPEYDVLEREAQIASLILHPEINQENNNVA